MAISTLKLERIGPIQTAEVHFGDLTVLVGPQATGKSIFLQLFKLVADTGYVHEQLRKHGIVCQDWSQFLEVYLGEGMQAIWRVEEAPSEILVNGQPKDANTLTKLKGRKREPTVFYIPAQRVLTLANGWPRPFTGFASEDPFAVRDFSETFRILMEEESRRAETLFPKTNRLKREYRELLARHVFGGFELCVDRHGAQRRLVLRQGEAGQRVPYLAWSAGQREFVPLLMGLYWLLPPSRVQRRDSIEWLILEEPEMGLHPNGISVVMLLILELLWRDYRVCISTHSPHVLDVVWALKMMQKYEADPTFVLEIFGVPKTEPMKKVAQAILGKQLRVCFFDRDGNTKDISNLDPASEKSWEAGWGGLIGASDHVNQIVARLVGEAQAKGAKP
jgi:hypothetical protein